MNTQYRSTFMLYLAFMYFFPSVLAVDVMPNLPSQLNKDDDNHKINIRFPLLL